MKRILIVEDDDAIRTGLCQSLSSDTLDAVGAGNLMSARQRLDTERYDLLLLDCNLPDGNGIDFCRELMKRMPIPVIFLTVRDSEIDEVAAFRAGACDYVKKPFSLMVLRERIAVFLERAEKRSDLYVDRRYRFDFASLDFFADGTRVYLGSTECKLLAVLVKNSGKVLSRGALTDALWDGGEELNENALSVAVSRLRGRLGEKSISILESPTNFVSTLLCRKKRGSLFIAMKRNCVAAAMSCVFPQLTTDYPSETCAFLPETCCPRTI